MASEGSRHRPVVTLPELCAALDVGEEEGQRARRKDLWPGTQAVSAGARLAARSPKERRTFSRRDGQRIRQALGDLCRGPALVRLDLADRRRSHADPPPQIRLGHIERAAAALEPGAERAFFHSDTGFRSRECLPGTMSFRSVTFCCHAYCSAERDHTHEEVWFHELD